MRGWLLRGGAVEARMPWRIDYGHAGAPDAEESRLADVLARPIEITIVGSVYDFEEPADGVGANESETKGDI